MPRWILIGIGFVLVLSSACFVRGAQPLDVAGIALGMSEAQVKQVSGCAPWGGNDEFTYGGCRHRGGKLGVQFTLKKRAHTILFVQELSLTEAEFLKAVEAKYAVRSFSRCQLFGPAYCAKPSPRTLLRVEYGCGNSGCTSAVELSDLEMQAEDSGKPRVPSF
jgi:hypothetical protein